MKKIPFINNHCLALERGLFLAIVLGLAAMLWAQDDVTVEVALSRNPITVQEQTIFTVSVTCDGSSRQDELQVTPPEFPHNLPFRVTTHPVQQQHRSYTSIVNGKFSSVNTTILNYHFTLRPTQAGTHQIPPLKVRVNNQDYTTQPLSVQVTPVTNSTSNRHQVQPLLKQHFSSKSAVSGSKVRLCFQILLPVNTPKNIRELEPTLPLEELSQHFILPNDLEQLQWQRRNTQINGVRYREFTLELPVTPRQIGKITIPGFQLKYVQDATRGSRRNGSQVDHFMGFFNDSETRVIYAEDSTLEVLPLPDYGKPDDFSGIIGSITVEATADPVEAVVGDPIILTLRIRGTMDPARTKLPPIQQQPALKQDFKVGMDDEPPQVEDNVAVFKRTIRPTRAGITAIPAIAIPYFDPEIKSYRYATSEPIPITVANARQITLADATGNGTIDNAAPQQELPANGDSTDLAGEEEPAAVLTHTLSPATPVEKYILWFILPPGIWLALLLCRLASGCIKADPARRASRKAAGKCRDAIKKISADAPDAHLHLRAAIQEFVAQRFGLTAGTITAEDFRKAAQQAQITPPAIQDMAQIITACDQMRYSGKTPQIHQLVKQLLETLKQF